MDTSSSSKVTVEYHDPSGIFSLISDDLAARLPLRNLNWKSTNRPLRQISSLHVEFVPDSFTSKSLKPPAQQAESNGTTSLDIVRSGVDTRKKAVKERRHQIPGLQTSPYLKLYILRADDKETYKTIERKKIRDWIRDNAVVSTKKGRSEKHDAFEWLIIHVVVPDTIASSEPRWREMTGESEELKERKKQMKLPGKSTRTVFDKLRADFNESGKSGQDRVAQIRLTRAQVPGDLLPTPAMATTIEETNEEREKAWDDLMSKIRTLILGPFDMRVRQYETDVAEQDSRRAMPGFNFCTFFIYKEGLAKAFESIGLVNDAMVIYDELSLGFETVLKTMSLSEFAGTATRFAPYTADIIDRIVGINKPETNGNLHSDAGSGEAFSRDYREKIVRSDISVFDFSCYLFARQNALILRLANARSSRFGSRSSAQDAPEDLVLISEVCWRAAGFIHNAARSLRQDLQSYRAWQWEKEVASPLSEADIESLVCSWTYTVAGQMLDETYSPALEGVTDPSRRDGLRNGMSNGLKHPAVASLGGVNAYPQRTTSLPARKSRTSEVKSRDSLQSASDSDLVSPPMSPRSEGPASAGPPAGLLELVTYRAELLMMQRKMLEQLAKQRQWVAGWALMEERHQPKLQDVDLNDTTAPSNGESDTTTTATNISSTLLPYTLKQAVASKEAFLASYERLSDRAMRLYVAATQSKRAEAIMGDLAIIRYQQSDYGYAASYFYHVLPFYAEEGWNLMEIEALRMHSMCLKQLGRKEEYVTTLLTLVAKACGWRKAQRRDTGRVAAFDEMADVSGLFPEVLARSVDVDLEVSSPADAYFDDIVLDREVLHHQDRDGFALRLGLLHLLDDEVHFDRVTARLISADDLQTELWLAATDVKLCQGANDILLSAPVVVFGSFLIERIVLHANKAVFVKEFKAPSDGDASLESEGHGDTDESIIPDKQPLVFLYPHEHAFDATLSLARHIEINKPRHLEVHLRSGRNDIEAVDLKLRPASAGLRLHLADAVYDNVGLRADGQPGQISLNGMSPSSTTLVKVPFTLEQTGIEIFVRLEATYTTSYGAITLLTSAKLPTQLPLDVEVNDDFDTDQLASHFTIQTTRQTPVVVTEMECRGSSVYDVECPPKLPMPMRVFQQQPVKLVHLVTRRTDGHVAVSQRDAALTLNLGYCSVEDTVLGSISTMFTGALENTEYTEFRRLLEPSMLQRARALIRPTDFDSALRLGELRLPTFDKMGWTEVIAGLPVSIRSELELWLRRWHDSHRTLAVDAKTTPPDLQCRMVIPVEVPSVDFVHRVSLDVTVSDTCTTGKEKLLVLGQPVKATVSVISTNNWRTAAPRNNSTGGSTAFSYDIQAESDSWLVGGRKRGRFLASNDSTHRFEVSLVPLKVGSLRLPHVDIQLAQNNAGGESDSPGKNDPELTYEMCYESRGLAYTVYRAQQKTRVFVPEGDDSSSSLDPVMAKDAG